MTPLGVGRPSGRAAVMSFYLVHSGTAQEDMRKVPERVKIVKITLAAGIGMDLSILNFGGTFIEELQSPMPTLGQ